MSRDTYNCHYLPRKPRLAAQGQAILVLSKAHEHFNVTVASWSPEWAAQVAAWRATEAPFGLLHVELTELRNGAREPGVLLYSAKDLDGLRDAACDLYGVADELSTSSGYFQCPQDDHDEGRIKTAVQAGFDRARAATKK
jgi:hypothetical protein